MSRALTGVAVGAGAPRRLAGIDRALPVWAAVVLALVFLMAMPLGWLVWMSVRADWPRSPSARRWHG